jgi:hypothetical protein
MTKPSDDDIAHLVASLQSESTEERVTVLQVLTQAPTGDVRVCRAVEALLNDQTIHRLLIPIRFGEVRLLAAAALAAERRVSGDRSPVVVCSTPLLSVDEIGVLARQAGLPHANARDQYARLRDRGLIQEREYTIEDPSQLGWS